MRAHRTGTIINVSSISPRCVGVGSGLYAATKLALEGLSEALALEALQHGIRVAIIEPGFFDTPIIEKSLSQLEVSSDSPYANIQRRAHAIYSAGKSSADDPQDVAEAIEHAISTDEPKLRYVVGGAAFVHGRARMSDEEYVQSFGRSMSDEEFFAEFATRFAPTSP
jgi:NAD(P)-dependent dehydrogenase (short-subunit alcohol dehydrogenase family)